MNPRPDLGIREPHGCKIEVRKEAAPALAPTSVLRGLTPDKEGLMPIILHPPADSESPERVA